MSSDNQKRLLFEKQPKSVDWARLFDCYVAPFCIACGVVGYALGVMGIADRFGK